LNGRADSASRQVSSLIGELRQCACQPLEFLALRRKKQLDRHYRKLALLNWGIATKKSCRTFGSRLRYGLSIISDGQPQGVGPYLSPVPAHSLYENRTVFGM
jgi:hypothetical protein